MESATATVQMPLLEVRNFSVGFRQYDKGLYQKDLEVIHNFTIDIYPGEILSVVGASGSGKSLLAHAILGLLPSNAYTAGSLKFNGQELSQEKKEALRGRDIALIPQSVNYLDPLCLVRRQIASPLRGSNDEAEKILERLQLPKETEDMYPFQLSGGMARRVLITTALTSGAKLIIADEPTPGLHTSVVQETLRSLRELTRRGCGILMITHDIDLAFETADRIAVFNDGITVEVVSAADFKAGPDNLKHPYSKALWHAIPQNGFKSIRGKNYSELIAGHEENFVKEDIV
jgi:peptide/nickel transport system ATP-binding protein